MPYLYAFSVALAQPGTPADEDAHDPALWLAAPDGATLNTLQQRRQRVHQVCTAALPGLAPQHLDLLDLAEILEQGDTPGPQSPTQALARYQRYLNLSCDRPYGRIGLQLFDTVAELEVQLGDPRQWQQMRPALQQDLAGLLEALAQAAGLHPTPVPGDAPGASHPQSHAGALLDRQAPRIAVFARKARRMDWQAALGRPAVWLTGLLAAAAALWLVLDAERTGSLVRQTDASHPQLFIAERLQEGRVGWALFPRYVLHGHVPSPDPQPKAVPATVQVHRDVALRTGQGARYTVLPTRDPDRPYVLRHEHEDAGPVLPLGELGLHWSATLALLPLACWYFVMLMPWRAAVRTDAHGWVQARHGVVSAWGGMLMWGLALVAVVAATRWWR